MEKENIRILLVDDEADFVKAMLFWLQSKGYSVITASDGKTAIELTKKSEPNLILLDLAMPGIDGIETLKRIRKFNQNVPVIILSAHVDELRAKILAPYNVSAVFYKGDELSSMLVLLETALRIHKDLKK